MKNLINSLLLLLAVSLASCTKDEPQIPINPDIRIEVADMPSSEKINLPKDGSVILSVKVENATDYAVRWSVDGKQTSTDKEFTFRAIEIGDHTIVVEVLNHDGGKTFAEIKIQVYENAQVYITLDGKEPADAISIPYFKSLSFTSDVKPDAQYAFSWLINKELVSSDPEYIFTPKEAGDYQIILNAKNQYGVVYADTTNVNVYDFSQGTFILNEGNMTTEQGSLIFISPKGELTDSLYWRVNGSFLGNTTQDLYITDQKLYVISQNGSGDGMLVIANAATLKKEAAYAKEEMGDLSWPTHLAIIGTKAYIRDNNGVHLFDLTTKAKQSIAGSKGAAKNRMAVVGDKVFVPAGKSIYVIQGNAIIRTITMPGTVSGVVRAYDNNLWVSCTTSPAQINKVSSSDYSILQTNELGDAKVGAGFGATPGISAKNDSIYFSNASTKIYRHIFSLNKTELMTDVKDHIDNAGIVYNNLAVNPQSGEVYFNTIKGYGMDFLVNDLTIFNFSGSTPQLVNDYKNVTHFPAGIFFTASYN